MTGTSLAGFVSHETTCRLSHGRAEPYMNRDRSAAMRPTAGGRKCRISLQGRGLLRLQPAEARLDDRDLLVDLADRQTEIIARPALQIDREPLPVHHQLVETAPVLQPDIDVDDLLNRARHEIGPGEKTRATHPRRRDIFGV